MFKNTLNQITGKLTKGLLRLNSCQIRMCSDKLTYWYKYNNVRNDSFNNIVLTYFDTTLSQNVKCAQADALKENERSRKFALLAEKIDSLKHAVSPAHEMTNIDTESCALLGEMTYDQILFLLRIFSKNAWRDVRHTKFLLRSMSILQNAMLSHNLNDRQLIQFLYYASVSSKTNDAYCIDMALLRIKDPTKLSTTELCIVALASYLCRTKVGKEYIKCFEDLLQTEAEYLVTNIEYLVSLCKALRYNGCSKDLDLQNLSRALCTHQGEESIASYTHILQLYASLDLFNKGAINFLVTRIIDHINVFTKLQLEGKEPVYNPAFNNMKKYVDNFLWSLRRLNYKMSRHQISIVMLYLKCNGSVLQQHPESMINILLSLWMLDPKAAQDLSPWLTECEFKLLLNHPAWKLRARLHLLLTCITIEAPYIPIPKNLNFDMKVGFPIPHAVTLVYYMIRNRSRQFGILNAEINCPVPAVYIPGISLEFNNGRRVHIDILNCKTCLKFTKTPNATMALKHRLLKKLGWFVIKFDEDCIADGTNIVQHIDKFLRDIDKMK